MNNTLKRTFTIFLIALTIVLTGCKKDKNNDVAKDVFLKFKLNGTDKSFAAQTGEAYYFANRIEGYIGVSDNGIMLSYDGGDFNKDSLQGLLNKKLSMNGSTTFSGRVFFDDGSTSYDTNDASSNPFPANYMKINKISFLEETNDGTFITTKYIIEGEFTANVSDGIGADKVMTNGTFRFVVYTLS